MPFSTVHTVIYYALNSCKTCNDDRIQIDKKHVPNPKNEATSTVNALNSLAHTFTMTVCTAVSVSPLDTYLGGTVTKYGLEQ